jgi:uncharacterized membrane protein YkoI
MTVLSLEEWWCVHIVVAGYVRRKSSGKSKTTNKIKIRHRSMKSKNIIKSLLTAAVVAGLSLNAAFAKDKNQSELEAKAKITKADAEKTALTKAPDGMVKDAELEDEDGKLVWSFDIARPGSKDITEVQVDAITGAIVSVEIEKPKDQKKEAKEDAAKEKSEKD